MFSAQDINPVSFKRIAVLEGTDVVAAWGVTPLVPEPEIAAVAKPKRVAKAKRGGVTAEQEIAAAAALPIDPATLPAQPSAAAWAAAIAVAVDAAERAAPAAPVAANTTGTKVYASDHYRAEADRLAAEGGYKAGLDGDWLRQQAAEWRRGAGLFKDRAASARNRPAPGDSQVERAAKAADRALADHYQARCLELAANCKALAAKR